MGFSVFFLCASDAQMCGFLPPCCAVFVLVVLGGDETHLTATPSGFRGLVHGYLGRGNLGVTYVLLWF